MEGKLRGIEHDFIAPGTIWRVGETDAIDPAALDMLCESLVQKRQAIIIEELRWAMWDDRITGFVNGALVGVGVGTLVYLFGAMMIGIWQGP